jgi:hypothetical protein
MSNYPLCHTEDGLRIIGAIEDVEATGHPAPSGYRKMLALVLQDDWFGRLADTPRERVINRKNMD